jgi:hypothetical protein
MQRSTKHLDLFSEIYVDLYAYNKHKTEPLKDTKKSFVLSKIRV